MLVTPVNRMSRLVTGTVDNAIGMAAKHCLFVNTNGLMRVNVPIAARDISMSRGW
jgi:hypothetical protein